MMSAEGKARNDERGTLHVRTKACTLQVIRLYASLPKSEEARVLGRQVLRSGTSVGAHYREATRARSRAEFISKLQAGLQELEETAYWLELLVEGGVGSTAQLSGMRSETDDLMAMLVSSVKTAKRSQS